MAQHRRRRSGDFPAGFIVGALGVATLLGVTQIRIGPTVGERYLAAAVPVEMAAVRLDGSTRPAVVPTPAEPPVLSADDAATVVSILEQPVTGVSEPGVYRPS